MHTYPIEKGNSPPLHMMTMFPLQLLVQISETINIVLNEKIEQLNLV
jgi:hypothetical protein